LPPSTQNFCWPRDQAFAVEALLSSGHIDEARRALQFIMNGRSGRYKIFQWNNQNVGIGVDYAVSIFRYLGNGVEESVLDDNGLTMHLDGLGLTLWNINRYVEITEDTKFLKYYWPKISRNIADVLPNLIDASGLVRSEPGPWEKTLPYKTLHLYSGLCLSRIARCGVAGASDE
jgi:GH15 family glucan-1,4-alpha-glucosidase